MVELTFKNRFLCSTKIIEFSENTSEAVHFKRIELTKSEEILIAYPTEIIKCNSFGWGLMVVILNL